MSDGGVIAEQNGPAGADSNTEDSSGESNISSESGVSEPGAAESDSTDSQSVQVSEAGRSVSGTSDNSGTTGGGIQSETQPDSGSSSNDSGPGSQDNQNPAVRDDSDNFNLANQNPGQAETGEAIDKPLDTVTETPMVSNSDSDEDRVPLPADEAIDQSTQTQPQVMASELLTAPLAIPLKLAGSVCDSTVTMSAGYKNIFAGDNSWEISLNTGTLKGGVGDDLTSSLNIEGLPEGLSWTAQNGGDNKILITVSGPASNMVLESTQVSVIVKGSAVNEADASDSDALSLNLNLNSSSPDAIAVDPAGTALYILIRESGQVLVVDVSSDSIRRTISLQDTPETGPEAMNDIGIALGMLAVLK
ncbi:MAG: hypothetical protein ABFD04_06745 [Syntrophomonas sp.]